MPKKPPPVASDINALPYEPRQNRWETPQARERQRKDIAEGKRRARLAVQSALRSGRLVRPLVCEECGGQRRLQAHHESYAPGMELRVRWVCKPCHSRLDDARRDV